MKKVVSLLCLFALLASVLCACSGNACEHCGKSTFAYNQVGDNEDGIRVCNDCIDKMRTNRLSFNFTCEACEEEKVGKKNKVTVDGEELTVCNTCKKSYEETGAFPK